MGRKYFACFSSDDLDRFALTPEQWEVMVRLSEGMAYAEVAAELAISLSAVKSRVKRVLARLHARNVREALSILSQRGMLSRKKPPRQDFKR